jgi:hypothetical protein
MAGHPLDARGVQIDLFPSMLLIAIPGIEVRLEVCSLMLFEEQTHLFCPV